MKMWIIIFKSFQVVSQMAQQMMQQDINVEDVLKGMVMVDGAKEYLVLNSEGIPIKKSSTITPEKALHLSFLITDYWATAKKVIQCDLKMHDNPIEQIRMRTSKQKEVIILQSQNNDATLYLVQNCETKKYQPVEEKKEKAD